MAQYNPFFEKAGMKRITERKPDISITEAIKSLKHLGFKPYLLYSQQANLNKLDRLSKDEIREVGEILLQVKTIYFKRLRSTSDIFLNKNEFRKMASNSP